MSTEADRGKPHEIREPTRTPKESFWRKDFSDDEIRHVLDKVRSLRNLEKDGTVSLGYSDLGEPERYEAILVTAIGFKVRTDALKSKIVSNTLLSPELKEEFTDKEFRDVAWRLRHKYQEVELRPYRVVFPLWNIPSFLTGRMKRGDVAINFSPSTQTGLFKKIARAREKQTSGCEFDWFFTAKKLSELSGCSTCIARVAANSAEDAHERASGALYEILGLINISAKHGGIHWRWSHSQGRRMPIANVLIGPHTTVHSDDGSLAFNGFWHENWEGVPSKMQRTEEQLTGWKKSFNNLVQGVERSPWSEDCRSAASRYFKAFSNPDLEGCFLEGWRLFENISGSRKDSVKQKLGRVSNVFPENIKHRVIGKHLQLRRNQITHVHPIRSDGREDETLALQMHRFVWTYLVQFIMNGSSFATQEELWEFLDLPASQAKRTAKVGRLRQQLKLLDKAAEFRGDA